MKLKRLILNKSDFDNCIFEKESDFYKTEFKLTSFKRTRFCGNCIFDKTIIYDTFDTYNLEKENKKTEDKIKFNFTKFEGITTFYKTVFIKKLDLTNTYFYNKVNFLGISSDKYIYKRINVKNRETARIIKDSFEQQNNIIEANKYYALEMKEREKELSKDLKKGENIFEWLVFKAHGLTSNHSQEWLLALFWIINLTFITTYLSYELFCVDVVKHIDKGLVFFGSLFVLGVVFSKFNEFYRNIAIIISTICIYLLYSNNYVNDSNLKEFSNMINPFSIMTRGEELSLGTLIYKILIAYLIYQFIVSIRQNTRRK